MSTILKAQIKQRWGIDVDPDKTYLVTFKNNREDEKDVVEKITLTQAALKNRQDLPLGENKNWFQKIAQYFSPAVYGYNKIENWVQAANSRQAIYREPEPPLASLYSSATKLPIPVDAFKSLVWNTDRTSLYKKTLDGFWEKHSASYTPLSKIAFVKAINLQRLERTLGPVEVKLAQRALGPVAQKAWSELTAEDFKNPAVKDPNLDIGLLSINGLQSTDLMCVTDRKTQLTLLCIPGNSSPIHRFDNPGQMRTWLAKQAADPVKRESLLTHFSLKDQARKALSDGVRQSLEGMGNWSDAQEPGSPVFSRLNMWYPDRFITTDPVSGDPFQEVMARQKARSYSDAENAIVSDSDYTKNKIVAGVEEATKVAMFMTPLALVMPEVAVALDVFFVTAGATEAGIGIDDVAKGKAAGTDRIVFGVLNAVPPLVTHVGAPLAKALTSSRLLSRVPGEGAAAGVDAGAEVAIQTGEKERRFFNPPQRVNGRIGYPMSPISAPVIVEEFKVPMDDIRQLGSNKTFITFGGYYCQVKYDVAAGVWRGFSEDGQVSEIYYWRTGEDQWASGTKAEAILGKQNGPISITNKTLKLPMLPSLPLNATEVPKVIHYFWAGNEIPEHLLKNIIENSRNSPGYKSIVHVDGNSEAVFQKISAELDHKVGGLEVHDLKNGEAFKELNASKYAEMYQYFRSGQGQNLSASSDVMRVALIKKYGGIYMDTDDTLTMNVGNVTLKAAPNDILLNGHVKYEPADFSGYNTSNFASHADNRVLENILEESYQRYKANEEWLGANRPMLSDNPTAAEEEVFKVYQKKIFEITGPRMVNDVLDQAQYGLLPMSEDIIDLLNAGVKLPDDYHQRLWEALSYYEPMRSRFGASIGSESSMNHSR
ncbi:sugar-binding protein [Pseudomonas simiae]|nr:sugar-binding protein [Pseudomonas simiae]